MSNQCDNLSEVEITAEMIDAGLDCFYELPELLGPTEDQLRETLKVAFCAMLRARREYQTGSALPSL